MVKIEHFCLAPFTSNNLATHVKKFPNWVWDPEFCQLGQKLKTKDYMAIQHKKVQGMGKVSHLPIDTTLTNFLMKNKDNKLRLKLCQAQV